MHDKVSVAGDIGKVTRASDRAHSPKRRWVTPDLRKLKVDQTEAGGGLFSDGNFVS